MHLDPPRCVPAPGNSAQQPDPVLLAMARDERLYNAGLSEQAFHLNKTSLRPDSSCQAGRST